LPEGLEMQIQVYSSSVELGKAAAVYGAVAIRGALAAQGAATIVLATGTSQYATLEALTAETWIEWSRVTAFHLDEYIGLTDQHPASFRRYLRERFASRVGNLAAFHYIRGEDPDPAGECRRLAGLIRRHPVDVAFLGIGENGHVAFNDPPADFDTEEPFIVVSLDEACRRQQVGEGWFASLAEVPERAISMSIPQILKARRLVVSVPDARKAEALWCAVEGPLSNRCPASALRMHGDCTLFLDRPAASRLSRLPGR
jgi:glucosamine-6-phosphate deaminase